MPGERSDFPAIIEPFHRRWRFVAVSCLVAGLASLGMSLLLPRKYTATSRIFMEAPAGSDPRAATAVSPIYLESLRTYELFASSDDLFLRAAQRFGLRAGSASIDRLKKSVLKVDVPRNTKILEISASLPDAKKAHDLALYLAQETVQLSRGVSRTADEELIAEAEKRVAAARAALEAREQAWSQGITSAPVDQISAQLQADVDVRARLQRQLYSAEADLASAEADPSDAAEVPPARARAERLRRDLHSLEQQIAGEQVSLAQRSARIARLDADRKTAQNALNSATGHMQEMRNTAGYRGERLDIIDPGIVPERPSSPNVPLNVLAALFAGLVLSALYVLLEAGYQAQKADVTRRPLRIASRND